MNFILLPKEDETAFINELVNTFPEIKKDVLDEDWVGLIHLQVGCFTRYTQRAIDINNISVAMKCFKFVEDIINKVEFNIENALVLSWISHLNFNKNETLYAQFPSELKQIRIKLEEHYANASENKKLNKFLKDI
jgi:hypothetical protein